MMTTSADPAPPAEADPEPDRSARRRPRTGMTMLLAAVVAVAVAATGVVLAVGPADVRQLMPGAPEGPAYDPEADPFEGTPAYWWDEGSIGIVHPEPKPAGEFGTSDVIEVLRLVEEALLAGHVDRRMLEQHDPTGFLELLSPAVRDDAAADFADGAVPVHAVQVSADVPLTDDVPRVRGSMTYRALQHQDSPALEIRTEHAWVYAFAVGSDRAAGDLVFISETLRWLFRRPDRATGSPGGLEPLDGTAWVWNADCATFQHGSISPLPDGVAAIPVGDGGQPITPMDPQVPDEWC